MPGQGRENGRVVTTTTEPRCPACGAPVPAESRHGKGRKPVYCGTDKCKQARARRAAERREAIALLRLAADLAAYGAVQVGNGLSPADARAAVGELAGELASIAVRLRRMARPGPAERRIVVRLLFAQGMSGTQIAARVGLSEKTVYRYRARPSCPRRSPDAG
jgi:DNA-directed RNA polymerase specialized sigma24 family protein